MQTKVFRVGIAALTMALTCACGTAQTQRWHARPHRVATVVVRTSATPHVSNRLSQKERLAMVMAYLRTHESLSIAQYARMTGLGKATAEAELDVFATDWGEPIRLVVNGKNKTYTCGA